MFLRVLLCFVVAVGLCAAKDIGYYSAIVRVERLLLAERKMVGKVKQYISQGGQVTGDLRSYVDSYDDSWLHPPRDDPLHFAHHPVGAYLLIKRLSQKHMKGVFQQAQDLIEKPNILVELPDKEDLEMSAFALVRLQLVYNLDINSLVQGQVVMTVTSPQSAVPQHIAVTGMEPTLTLDLSDTMFIGDVACRQNDSESGILWYNFNLASADGLNSRVRALSRIASAHSKLKQHEKAFTIYREALELDPDNQILYADYDDAMRLAALGGTAVDEAPAKLKASLAKSRHLCRLDVLQNVAPRRGLKCRYVRDSPHLYISPAKMEVLHRKNPRLVMYHDVISQNEARTFRSTGFPKFRRTLALDGKGRVYIDIYSVSESGSIRDKEDSFIGKMSRRVGHLTGLSTGPPHAEPMMVFNFGLGGAIQHHKDYMAEAHKYQTALDGNRMVTFLIYLNEVEAGGAVVFPDLDLITPAVQNAALMIENLNKSGDNLPRSQHAGCPVLIGSKWTAIKYIREFGNEFKRPCGLTPDE
ncbi:prolyl 4-hydroxylase subunit alpha-3-like [Branchiostoma lanceolatum]|uniref:prolyl 4-hydroxylase subunit alpha-3-like n=1 Tax=Branchiostoma lanceolatum TaxID=7740 RepID=UPI003451C92F